MSSSMFVDLGDRPTVVAGRGEGVPVDGKDRGEIADVERGDLLVSFDIITELALNSLAVFGALTLARDDASSDRVD